MHSKAGYIIIIILSALLFIPFLGGVHLFDWDEINFAECAREMIVSGDYLRPQIDFMPFWEKPPLFIWLQVLAMKMFGVGAFAARLPDALVGIATLATVYHCGRKLVSEKMAQWWVLMFAASWLPHFYFKTGIIDPLFNLLIFLAFYQIHLLRSTSRPWLQAASGGLALGMAALTKGPVAILVALLALIVYVILNRGLNGYKIKHLLVVAVCAAIPFSAWIGITAAIHGGEYGSWFLKEFIDYQIRLFATEDSDHGGPFFYHFVVLLIGCFPASVFLFQYIGKQSRVATKTDFSRWMWLLFWVVLILFSVVKTKIVHYSSLCYFPLTYLAAMQLQAIEAGIVSLRKSTRVLLLSVGVLLAIVILLLPVVGMHKNLLIPLIADPFAVANLRADVQWSYAGCGIGMAYIAAMIITSVIIKNSFRRGIIILCVAQILVIQAVVLYCTPQIEGYSQRAAIDYYKSFQGQDVYVHPLGFKSYANLYYTRKQPWTSPQYRGVRKDKSGRETPEANEQWLLHGKTDKPVYFICKVHDSMKYSNAAQLELTGSKNGFLFYRKIQ